jgi:hypothetical protein
MMKLRILLKAGLLATAVVLLAACAPGDGDRGAPAVQQEAVYDDILASMRATGADVVLEEDVSQPLVPGDTRLFRVNGELVQIIVFTDEVTRRTAETELDLRAGLIPETGAEVTDILYYWAHEQTVAMYVGDNEEVIDTVTAALGEPLIAGQDGPLVETPEP